MPRIYRVMREADEKPLVGVESCMLGARLTDLSREDNTEEDNTENELVEPEKAGLSVGGCVRTTYISILPRRLQTLYPEWARGAKGRNSDKVWAMGQGSYLAAPVSADLDLRFRTDDRPGHGLVAPSRKMALEEYQAALAATRDEWEVEEEHNSDCAVCRQFGVS